MKCKKYEHMDLLTAGTLYQIIPEDISERSRYRLEEAGYDIDEPVWLTEKEITELNIPYGEVRWDDAFYDEEWLDSVQPDLIGDYPCYLSFGYGLGWRSLEGYRFDDSFQEALTRSYDCGIYPVSQSKRKKTLEVREYSHDAPAGSRIYIIGLTEDEAKKLKFAEYKTIRDFAQRQAEKV